MLVFSNVFSIHFNTDVSGRTDATRAALPSRGWHETTERSGSQQHATWPAWTEPDAAPVWTAERCPLRPAATATAGARPAATRREEEQYISGTRGAYCLLGVEGPWTKVVEVR